MRRHRASAALLLVLLADCTLLTDLRGLDDGATSGLGDDAGDRRDASSGDAGGGRDGAPNDASTGDAATADSRACDAARFCACYLDVTFCSDFDDSTLQGVFTKVEGDPAVTLDLDSVQYQSPPTALRGRLTQDASAGVGGFLEKIFTGLGPTSSLSVRYAARVDALEGGDLTAMYTTFVDVDHAVELLWRRSSGVELQLYVQETYHDTPDGGGPRQFATVAVPVQIVLGTWRDYEVEVSFSGAPRAKVFVDGVLELDTSLNSAAVGTALYFRTGITYSTALSSSVSIDNFVADRK